MKGEGDMINWMIVFIAAFTPQLYLAVHVILD
jgi:hypothetical protein